MFLDDDLWLAIYLQKEKNSLIKNLMNESWKFLTEVHKFSDLPKDEIPEIVFYIRVI